MTRKRFKKLLMSYGYSRDDAEWLTDFAKNSVMSYADFYNSRKYAFEAFKVLHITKMQFANVNRAMTSIYRNFLSGLNHVQGSFAKLGEECSKIMSEFKKGY